MDIPFYKMNGAGNDFIVIDNREGVVEKLGIPLERFVRLVCRRRKAIGADGVMLLERSSLASFKMRYFNSDGSEGEMCGNGARCIAKFAYIIGVSGEDVRFETLAGICEAKVLGENVKVRFFDLDLKDFRLAQVHDFGLGPMEYHFSMVGVPHVVLYRNDVEALSRDELISIARKVRYSFDVFPKGTNVNFVRVLNDREMVIRTYERGVEDETLACGTGSIASSVISSLLFDMRPPITVRAKGGILKVDFNLEGDSVRNVYLEGDARVVARGYIMPDALIED